MIFNGFGISYEDVRSWGLDEALDFATVAEIKDVISRLKLPVRKTGKKGELIDRVVDFIKENPKYLVERLSLDELEITRKVLAGERVVGTPHVLDTFCVLVQLGWVQMRELKGAPEVAELIITEEAENLIGSLVVNHEVTLPQRAYQFISRWGALCGILPLKAIMERLHRMPEYKDIQDDAVIDSIKTYAGASYLDFIDIFNNGKGDLAYMTPWCMYVGSIGKLLHNEVQIDGKWVHVNAFEPKQFSDDDIMAVGLPLFEPVTPNVAQRDKLMRIIMRHGKDEYAAREMLLETWTEKQKDSGTRVIGELAGQMEFHSIDELNEFIAALNGYMNTLPFWKFLGKSSEEEYRDHPLDPIRPPRLTAGPNMRAMGLDITPEQQRMFEDMMRESALASRMPSGQWPVGMKVGRNDPRPCGSGRKFKNCCGK